MIYSRTFLKSWNFPCAACMSSPAERIFSMMGSIWTVERGRLLVPVVKKLLIIKANSILTCPEFYEKIITPKKFLHRIISFENFLLKEIGKGYEKVDEPPYPGTRSN
ncbi:hypothetical protein AVEN_115378-1 [Araneus ventricosus]|uniref:HAT C-terminal dimerisation domain-containing protein n=1 Tax=Araneus ventricosus TaxID=182803 RepID=A0A4Y1ZYH6_ARAVE|nr:hypothetical protein AVEN_115378-1 [Araneus ventricosus]